MDTDTIICIKSDGAGKHLKSVVLKNQAENFDKLESNKNKKTVRIVTNI